MQVIKKEVLRHATTSTQKINLFSKKAEELFNIGSLSEVTCDYCEANDCSKNHALVEEYYYSGRDYIKKANISLAESYFYKALKAIPHNKFKCTKSFKIYKALADISFSTNNFSKSLSLYRLANRCYTGMVDPEVIMRIGQCEFELKKFRDARVNMDKAFWSMDIDLFQFEHPKYYEFYKKSIRDQLL